MKELNEMDLKQVEGGYSDTNDRPFGRSDYEQPSKGGSSSGVSSFDIFIAVLWMWANSN